MKDIFRNLKTLKFIKEQTNSEKIDMSEKIRRVREFLTEKIEVEADEHVSKGETNVFK